MLCFLAAYDYDQFTRLTAGGAQRPSSTWALGAYRRMLTPSVPWAGEGSQLDSLSLPGDSC